jgi:hypothetical protein
MTTLTLLAKISTDFQLKLVSKALRRMLQGLEVEAKVLGTIAGGWVQVGVSGEDEGVATNYLVKEIGLCPISFGSIRKFSVLKGYVKGIKADVGELLVDVGVFQPKNVYATLGLRRLRAQLVDGREVALRRIVELFGFCEGLPVNVKVTSLKAEASRVDAELASKQVGIYVAWRDSLLDRLLVLGSSLGEVKEALKQAKLERDVIDVESLGLLEHALTCKLGTDAAGLIPKIGRRLRNSKFAVFNPKALRAFLIAEN